MNSENRKLSLQDAAQAIIEGGIVLCPTDTIYGLSCDAKNIEALEKISELKGREDGKSFIVLVNSDRLFNQCTSNVPEVAWDLIDQADSPLTLVVPASNYLPEKLRPNNMVAIRYVNGNYVSELIQKVNRPIVSSSANISGEKSATRFSAISEKIINGVDYIVEEVYDDSGLEKASKIIMLKENGEVHILRK